MIGETGTGKELVARALHRLSPAAKGNFVVLNCSAVVETLFEKASCLGHTKGAFTGATHDKPGLFEHASGGTLFLDEIGDMPLATQAKLLRGLAKSGGPASRVAESAKSGYARHRRNESGSTSSHRGQAFSRGLVLSAVDGRNWTTATGGTPRRSTPPLAAFIAKFGVEYGKRIRGLTHRAQFALTAHTWPGNVRELENALGHASMMVMSDTIDVQDLPEYLRAVPHNGAGSIPSTEIVPPPRAWSS